MDPWKIWFWPWTILTELGPAEEGRAVSAPRDEDWFSPNRVRLELEGLRLRDFSVDAESARKTLVVAPFSLHDARLADLACGHSLIAALRANGCSRLFLTDWRSATERMRLRTIDSYLGDLNVVVDDLEPPVDLIGLCQGGWLSLLFAARFPGKVRRIALAGAPIDVMAEPSECRERATTTPDSMIDAMIRCGEGRVLGKILRELWPAPHGETAAALEALQLGAPLENDGDLETVARFRRWHERTLDLPALYYLEVVNWIFRENQIAQGKFRALGRVVRLRELRGPLFLLAGEKDTVAPAKQVLAAAALTGAPAENVETAIAPCNHLALFMGSETLRNEWPRIARWLQA
jgi:poly(3-hydroxyalkanoate) synthetase